MLWTEFNSRVGEVSEGTYEFANRIYAYHPIIPDVDGKDKIANLFLHSNPRKFFELYDEATHIMEIDEKIWEAKQPIRDRPAESFMYKQAMKRLESLEQVKTDYINRLKEKYNL